MERSKLLVWDEMNDRRYEGLPIIDCHTHIYDYDHFDRLADNFKTYGFEAWNILSLSACGEEYIHQNILCMLMKLRYPEKTYAFGGLCYPSGETLTKENTMFDNQVKSLDQMGFDGIKMIEGKPALRKKYRVPLDSSIYDDFFAYIEKEKIPVIYHVADPEAFWDKNAVPRFAFEAGWFYGDGSYPCKESLYSEAEGILKKFPQMKIIFAHFFFLSEDMQRAGEFLDKWPSASVDITPGGEMFVGFSKCPQKWRNFFIKYQDRILFGTDNDYGDSANIINSMRAFLETEKSYSYWGGDIQGIQLPMEVLEKIYYKNFLKYVTKAPKKVNIQLLAEECGRVREKIEKGLNKEKLLPVLYASQEKLNVFKP